MIRRPPRSTLFPTRRSSDLFRGRDDVYAARWEGRNGRTGYSPAGIREWSRANSVGQGDRKSTRLNSNHVRISYAVFCLKKKTKIIDMAAQMRTLIQDSL